VVTILDFPISKFEYVRSFGPWTAHKSISPRSSTLDTSVRALGLDCRANGFDSDRDGPDQLRRGGLQPELTRDDPRDVEDVVDETHAPAHFCGEHSSAGPR
jgi:hypothetical protein